MSTRHRHAPLRRIAALTSLAAVVISAPAVTAADAGFRTAQPAMLQPVAAGATVTPLITVGERLRSGYRFEAIPDGIAFDARGNGRVDLYINHETSTVPFPYAPTNPTPFNSQNDFNNAQLSKLALSQRSLGILQGWYAIDSAANYQRFCSNFLATAANGFDRNILFTNEEAVDWFNRTGTAWPATEGAPEARQGGVVVAYDVRSGRYRSIWGMGRHNHENAVAIPGFGHPVVLSGDDTFVNFPSQSQLYSYIAASADAVWNDTGDLWAFVTNDASRERYEQFVRNDPTVVTGRFIRVPKLIATGRNPDGTEVMSDDAEAALGVPAGTYDVPTDGSFSRPPGSPPSGGNIPSVDGPQWVLERWSQLNHVFRFIRVEDIAYDRRPGMSNVVYVVDSGRGSSGDAADGKSTNGRIWKLVLDPSDATVVTSFSIFIEGDDNPVKTVSEIHQPDNIESTLNGLYFTEDPGSGQQFNFTDQLSDTRRTTARIWQYRFNPAPGAANLVVVARVDQSADEGPTDVDPAPPPSTPGGTPPPPQGNLGAWESSGIIDASSVFGPGAFLVTVQAHTLWVDSAPGPGFTYKREGGQLVLLRIPNA